MAKEILMPALTPTMESGAIARWLVQPGDRVVAGQAIAEIETDKSVLELETLHEGLISELRFPDGAQDVPVDAVIALLLEPGEEAAAERADERRSAKAAAASPNASAQNPSPTQAAPRPTVPVQAAAEQAVPSAVAVRAPSSPAAKRLAREAGLDIASIPGTGPGGRVVAKDVKAAAQVAKRGAREAAPLGEPGIAEADAIESVGSDAPETAGADAPDTPWTAPGEEQTLSTLQKTMARRMAEAKATIPHLYCSMDIRVDALLKLRRELDESDGGPKASLNDWLVFAAARALRSNPSMNAQYRDGSKLAFSRADISVAVAIEEGLVTPVVRGADALSLGQIAQETRRLAERARRRRLRPEEYQGGTFTISNAGGFGLKQIWPIINPPQAGILGVGRAALQPVATDGALQAAWILPVTLAADHRLIDGAIAGAFLRSLQGYLEHPARLFLES